MRIRDLLWPDDRIDHIAEHGIKPGGGRGGLLWRAAGAAREIKRKKRGILRFGTDSRRTLLVLRDNSLARRKGYPVTARLMTRKEKSRYRKWKNQ